MSKRITYFLGAGASFQACPIWKEQGEKMIELAIKYLPEEKKNFKDKKPDSLTEQEDILWDMAYFGNKALEYGTIDTYAKKLYLSDDYERELQRLKLAVSIFFTLWESGNDAVKERKGEKLKYIDVRYISLLAAILEGTSNNAPKLKSNVSFVTWNYDLQLERAFKSYCLNHLGWDYVSKNLSFRVNENSRDLEVCHLNGYNGYYYLNSKDEKNKEYDTLDRTDSKNIVDILNAIGFTSTEVKRRGIRINDHINFAWENNPLAITTRDQARKIFSETDILVIIGYSFPPFNKEIDSSLFEQLKGRKITIYYQDPQAAGDYLKILANGIDCEIHLINDKIDHFHLPYDF
jgi:hypothetical protein